MNCFVGFKNIGNVVWLMLFLKWFIVSVGLLNCLIWEIKLNVFMCIFSGLSKCLFK